MNETIESLASIFEPTLPWWEFVVRGIVMYVAVLCLIRLLGNRVLSDMTLFDLVLLLLLGGAAANGLRGNDTSIGGAILVIAAMLGMNYIVAKVIRNSRFAHRLIEGQPEFLIRDGKVDYAVMRSMSITNNDLLAALRSEGCFLPAEVDYAVIETSGRITVRPKAGKGHRAENGNGRQPADGPDPGMNSTPRPDRASP